MRLLLLGLALVLCADAAHQDVMARSDFHWGDEEWSAYGPGRIDIYARNGMLYGADNGRKIWYFRAPESFLGDKCFVHNGELSFRLGHSEYMSNGKDMIRDWDLILESKLWKLRFGIKNLIPPWVGSSKHTVLLNENSWININSGHPPTTIEMLRMLTAISGLYIRGGFYDGHEETWIDEVQLTEGDHKQDVLLRKIEKHAKHPSTIKPVEPPPPPDPEEHMDHEDIMARKLEEARIAREKERLEKEEAEKLAEEHAKKLFEEEASSEEKEVAKVLEREHEGKSEHGDLTVEEIQYAVDTAEKEMLRKLMEKQEEESKIQKERETLLSSAHSRHEERVVLADQKEEKKHEEHLLSPDEKHKQQHGGRGERDVHDLHHKAHAAAHARHPHEAEHHHDKAPTSPPVAAAIAGSEAPPKITAPPRGTDGDISIEEGDISIEEGDISIEEAARIAAQQEQKKTEDANRSPPSPLHPVEEITPISETPPAKTTATTPEEAETSSSSKAANDQQQSQPAASTHRISRNSTTSPPSSAKENVSTKSATATKIVEGRNSSSENTGGKKDETDKGKGTPGATAAGAGPATPPSTSSSSSASSSSASATRAAASSQKK